MLVSDNHLIVSVSLGYMNYLMNHRLLYFVELETLSIKQIMRSLPRCQDVKQLVPDDTSILIVTAG